MITGGGAGGHVRVVLIQMRTEKKGSRLTMKMNLRPCGRIEKNRKIDEYKATYHGFMPLSRSACRPSGTSQRKSTSSPVGLPGFFSEKWHIAACVALHIDLQEPSESSLGLDHLQQYAPISVRSMPPSYVTAGQKSASSSLRLLLPRWN